MEPAAAPMDLLSLLPPECLALGLTKLTPRDAAAAKLSLFRTGHAGRLIVLSITTRVSVSPIAGAIWSWKMTRQLQWFMRVALIISEVVLLTSCFGRMSGSTLGMLIFCLQYWLADITILRSMPYYLHAAWPSVGVSEILSPYPVHALAPVLLMGSYLMSNPGPGLVRLWARSSEGFMLACILGEALVYLMAKGAARAGCLRNSMQTVARLLAASPSRRQPCYTALKVCFQHQDQLSLLLPQIHELQAGRVTELELMSPDACGPGKKGIGKQPAVIAAAACGHLRKLILRDVLFEDGAFFTTLAQVSTQLSSLVMKDVTLVRGEADQSLGELGTALPALNELEIERMGAPLIVQYPQLLQRITTLKVSSGTKGQCHSIPWGDLLMKNPQPFLSLHHLHYNTSIGLGFLHALQGCPALTHIVVQEVLADSNQGIVLNLPPALQELSLSSPSVAHLRNFLPRFLNSQGLMQEPDLKITRLNLPSTVGDNSLFTTDHAAAAAMSTTAALLASMPRLVLGEPLHAGSADARSRCLSLGTLPTGDLGRLLLSALSPLASHLKCVALAKLQLGTPSVILAAGAAFGECDTMCLLGFDMPADVLPRLVWDSLLAGMPVLEVLWFAQGMDASLSTSYLPFVRTAPSQTNALCLEGLSAACVTRQRRLELQVLKAAVSESQAGALSNKWLKVLRV